VVLFPTSINYKCSQTKRENFVPTTSCLSFSAKVYIRLPSSSDLGWNRYVTPFSYGLWLAVAIAICALSVCLAVTYFLYNSNKTFTLIATLFYIPACFCQQGQHANPHYKFFPRFINSLVAPSLIFFFGGYF
jgi:hypothetical protein